MTRGGNNAELLVVPAAAARACLLARRAEVAAMRAMFNKPRQPSTLGDAAQDWMSALSLECQVKAQARRGSPAPGAWRAPAGPVRQQTHASGPRLVGRALALQRAAGPTAR